MKKNKIGIRDLLTYRFPENLQYSPDGRLLAFQVAKAVEKKNDYHRDVWLVKDGRAEQLTASLSTNLAAWDDNTHLLVTRTTEDSEPGVTKLYRMDVNGGEAQEWITLPFQMSAIKKVADGLYAVAGIIDAKDPDAYLDSSEERQKKAEEKKKDADYQVVDEVPYWHNGQGFTNKMRKALFLVQTAPALNVKRITAADFDMSSFIVEGKTIYLTGNAWTRRATMYDRIYSYQTDTRKKATVYGKADYSIDRLFVLNGQLYAMASDMKEYGINETKNICRVTAQGLELVKDPQRSLYNSVAVDTMLGGGKMNAVAGGSWFTLASDEDHCGIWKYDSKFAKTVLFDQPGSVFFLDASDKKIAFAYSSSESLTEIYEMDHSGRNVVRLTSLNAAALKDKYVAKPHRVNYRSHDLQLHGWVLLPDGFAQNRKYPAVLDVHGGPRCVYSEAFFHEMQVWAARGYVVMFANIFGGDGRDDAFADIRGKYGEIDFDNLMDFTDAVLKKYPNIDPKKLCETGGSYGGFMTNWIIGHTDRFCAAASQRSISNWTSMTFISDIGEIFGPDQLGTDQLFGDYEIYWQHSPLKYAAHVKTPTLFIHSDQDYRCPLPEGMQMMQALTYRNIETRMVIFHGENHELSRSGKPLHRIRRLEEITGWFDKHTK